MRLTYRLLAGLALFLASAKTGMAQELTRDEVVARYQEAMYPAGLAFESMYAEMELDMAGNVMPATMWMTTNGQMRMEMSLLDTRMVMTLNERGGWVKTNDAPADTMQPTMKAQFISQIENSRPDRWRKFINPQTTYEGLDSSLGFQAHLLVVPVVDELKKHMDTHMANSGVEGAQFSNLYIYLDPSSYRMVYMRMPFVFQGQELTSIVTAKDYGLSAGFPVPAECGVLFEMGGETQPIMRMRFLKYSFNQEMDSGLFERPE